MTRNDNQPSTDWHLAILCALLMSICALSAHAGEVSLAWDAAPTATSYNVYRGASATGNYTLVGTVTETAATVSVPDCVESYFYVKSLRNTVESAAASNIVSGYPEPTIDTISPQSDGSIIVRGTNLSGVANVELLDPELPIPATFTTRSCTEIVITADIPVNINNIRVNLADDVWEVGANFTIAPTPPQNLRRTAIF